AIGVTQPIDLEDAIAFHARALLLDAHAPDVYGGTGHTIDWKVAAGFISSHPGLPVLLAGGITPDNA
ncbi:MAG: N-(5'-phosphoribosyl)anthranilate isomerase, partial [Akkermansiaceae bacterium]|nr:N-(5'-phosphoribosyl)anthranilate isomerase [Akkermansiaceae bacterium]